jgi:hypothetical protein
MRRNPRPLTGLGLLGFVGVSLVLAACGIEDFVLLEPPEQILIAGDKLFEFRKTSANSELSFIGFDLYYKIFQTSDSPVAVDVFVFEDLAARGYKRIHSDVDRVGSISAPLMKIDSADDPAAFVITVDFGTTNPLIDPYPQYDHDGGASTVFTNNTSIRRGVNYTETGREDEFKKFTDFSAQDIGKDITSDIWDDISVGGSEVLVVMYVISYGFDFESFKVVYSKPVYLGEVTRIFSVE